MGPGPERELAQPGTAQLCLVTEQAFLRWILQGSGQGSLCLSDPGVLVGFCLLRAVSRLRVALLSPPSSLGDQLGEASHLPCGKGQRGFCGLNERLLPPRLRTQ